MKHLARLLLILLMFVSAAVFILVFLGLGKSIFNYDTFYQLLKEANNNLVLLYVLICCAISFYFSAVFSLTTLFYLSDRVNLVSKEFTRSLFTGTEEEFSKIKSYFCLLKEKD